MQFTLHATRRTPHGASRLVQAMSACLVTTRRAPSRHSRDARVYGHTTTAMHELNVPLPPPPAVAYQLQKSAQPCSDRVSLVNRFACVTPDNNFHHASAGAGSARADLSHNRHLKGCHSRSRHHQRLEKRAFVGEKRRAVAAKGRGTRGIRYSSHCRPCRLCT